MSPGDASLVMLNAGAYENTIADDGAAADSRASPEGRRRQPDSRASDCHWACSRIDVIRHIRARVLPLYLTLY